jgi:hypothetical protein
LQTRVSEHMLLALTLVALAFIILLRWMDARDGSPLEKAVVLVVRAAPRGRGAAWMWDVFAVGSLTVAPSLTRLPAALRAQETQMAELSSAVTIDQVPKRPRGPR